MKSVFLLLGAIAGADALNKSTVCNAPRLSVQGADTILARKYANALSSAGQPFVTYEHGVGWRALEMVYSATKNSSYLDYIKASANNLVTAAGDILDYNLTYYTLDDIRIGESLIVLNQATKEAKYSGAAHLLREQLQSNPRNALGAYWHRSTYPNQQWLDGLYMVCPFYVHYTAVYDPTNTTAYDDIVKQFTLAHTNCVNNNPGQKGLLKHGNDISRVAVWADAATGASPECWDRALGWYVMAIVDTLDFLPKSHPGFAKLVEILEENVAGITANVDAASKMWWLVMSQPGREGNYIESSGAAMFIYAILKGIRKGYLDESTYKTTATVAYEAMVEKFVAKNPTDGGLEWTGTVRVGSLNGKGDFAYYISVDLSTNDLKGFGPFIMAAVEYEKAVC